MAIELSVCIPTYNRVESLKPLLVQIESLWGACPEADSIEVCFSDNGSDDGSWELLQSYASRLSFLSIRHSEENEGFGCNFWQVAEMARGSYIYFTGDDDAFQNNAFECLLKQVNRDADLILLNSHSTAGMRWDLFSGDEVVPLASLDDYLNKVGLFHASFIGNLMFKREVFLRHGQIGDAIHQSAYPHLFPVFRALRNGKTLFMNSPVTVPDDSVRGWHKMQPVYTTVDMARIVREEVLPYLPKPTGRALLFQLARSMPRAIVWRLKKQITTDKHNPYQSLSVANLHSIYS